MANYSKEAERQNKALGNLLKGQEVEKRTIVGYEGKQKEKGDVKSELTDIMSEVRMPLFCPKWKKTMKMNKREEQQGHNNKEHEENTYTQRKNNNKQSMS